MKHFCKSPCMLYLYQNLILFWDIWVFPPHPLMYPRSCLSSCHPTLQWSYEATPPWWPWPLWLCDSEKVVPPYSQLRPTTVLTPPPHRGCTPRGVGEQGNRELMRLSNPIASFTKIVLTSSAPMCSVFKPGCSFTTCFSMSITSLTAFSLWGFRVPTQYGASLRFHKGRCFNTNCDRKSRSGASWHFKLVKQELGFSLTSMWPNVCTSGMISIPLDLTNSCMDRTSSGLQMVHKHDSFYSSLSLGCYFICHHVVIVLLSIK